MMVEIVVHALSATPDRLDDHRLENELTGMITRYLGGAPRWLRTISSSSTGYAAGGGPAGPSWASRRRPAPTREVAFVYRLRGGRIAERWAVRDDLAMVRQLGAFGAG
jgi:hypothetical protein